MNSSSRNYRWALLAAAIVAARAAHPGYADTTSTWNGTTGNWSDSTRWSTNPNYPNNDTPPGTLYDAVIGSGTVTLDVSPEIQSLTFSSGTLTGVGNLTIDATMNWSGGDTLRGSGTTTTKDLNLSNVSGYLYMNDTRALISTGTATWTANGGYSVNLTATNTYTNQGAFAITTSGNPNWIGGTFNNPGTFTKTSTDNNTISALFNNTGSVSVTAGTLSLSGGGTDTGSFSTSGSGTLLFSGGIHNFNSGASVTNLNVTGGQVHFNSGSTIATGGSMTLTRGITTLANSAGLSTDVAAFTMTPASARLDLTNTKLIVQATPVTKSTVLSSVQADASYGRTHTTGINSSVTPANMVVAVMDNGALATPFSVFGGLPVDANSILAAPELLGDANADGKVNFSDFVILSNHFGMTNAGWAGADFNGDGITNFADFVILSNNFGDVIGPPFTANLAAGPLEAQAAQTVGIPEPGTLALLSLAGVLLLHRRRR